MRKFFLNGDKRVRVIARTPVKGSEGDLCVQSDLAKTDINSILHRYAGNLAELKAWQDGREFGVQSPLGDDLLDATSVFESLESQYNNNAQLSKAFANFGDFVRSVSDGTIYSKLKGNENEQAQESIQTSESTGVPQVGEPTPPIEH